MRQGGPPGAVFLLTDYGERDELAGVLRAVLQRLAPSAPLVDLTHGVPPFDVRAGALALERAAPHLGPGVVVAVVDPGVGGGRRPLAVATRTASGPAFVVGPDNGLLGPALDVLGAAEAVALSVPGGRGGRAAVTFDGRDVFAPAAARLWSGERLGSLGRPVDLASLERLAPPVRRVADGVLETEVLWVDRFGNVELSARPDDLVSAGLGGGEGGGGELEISTPAPARIRRARLVSSFGDLGAGEAGLLADANDRLALVLRCAHAGEALSLSEGDKVTVRAPSDPA